MTITGPSASTNSFGASAMLGHAFLVQWVLSKGDSRLSAGLQALPPGRNDHLIIPGTF